MTRQIPYVVEGFVDVTVVRKMYQAVGLLVSKHRPSLRAGGQSQVIDHVQQHLAIKPGKQLVAFVDLDDITTKGKYKCARELRERNGLVGIDRQVCFRVAVREAEAWLLADRDKIMEFLAVDDNAAYRRIVGSSPDDIPDPKLALCQLAALSSNPNVVSDVRLTPSGSEAMGYRLAMLEYARSYWRPKIATANSRSLRCAVRRLEQLRDEGEIGIDLCQ